VAAREKGKAEQFASDFDIPKVKIREIENKNKSHRKIGHVLFKFACAGILEQSVGGLGTEKEQGCRTGPPGFIGWQKRFLGIYSWTPEKFKNTGSGCRKRFCRFQLGSVLLNTFQK
jgi:hypothetical protein